MSIILGKLNSILLREHFGVNAQIVGDCLFSAVQSRPLSTIVKATGLTKNEVSAALASLIRFRLVKFGPGSSGNFVEYSIKADKVYLLVRYAKYVQYIREKCGELAGLLINELQRVGSDIATNLIIKCTETDVGRDKLCELRREFLNLVQKNYVMRAPALVKGNEPNFVPEFNIDEHSFFMEPEIDVATLIRLKNREAVEPSDKEVYWFVNIDRLHQEFRDSVMVGAVERSIDSTAAECFCCMLELMYARTAAWQAVTNPVSYSEIRHTIEKSPKWKLNAKLAKQLDQYIAVICEDNLKFVGKFGEAGGGQYVIQMKHAIEQLTWSCIENVIDERFGKKAARIFRIVRSQRYCDQDDIQKEAMIPSKEAKLFTYKLVEENFFQIKTIRKSGAGGGGAAKSFCLFHVDQPQIVSMLLEHCYKALFNCLTRTDYIKTEGRRLIEKAQRLEMIVQAMKERGESEEYIQEIYETMTPPEKDLLENINTRCKNLMYAEIGMDETIFLLQLYQDYQHLK
ncbi:DNA-directed RNA polymerase III subunit RPC3 [Sitodiplosis mosellana]|uniref:DNA-directed RNA polymerase III subunit RPC3 n=1 Tax=Sitodiplosis mosellana TaxID=263140 RepID=UPI0024437EB6|nr:DNA-directed RNA polymerase III subunit RPC3 [Sitodiplosis mosellana]